MELLIKVNDLIQSGHQTKYMNVCYRMIAIDLLGYMVQLKHLDTHSLLVDVDRIYVSYFLYNVLQISYRLSDGLILFITINQAKENTDSFARLSIFHPFSQDIGKIASQMPYMTEIYDLADLKVSLLEVFYQLYGRKLLEPAHDEQ